MKKKIDRRKLLQNGGVALGLPWLEVMAGARPAWSQASPGYTSDGRAKRLLILCSTLGTIPNEWARGTGTGFTLGNILSPLQDHKDKLTVVQGLWQSGRNGAHAGRDVGMLTGQELLGDNDTSNNASGISIDQRIADAVDQRTTRRSLHFDLGGSSSEARLISHRGHSQPVVPTRNVHQAFDRLFSSVTPGGGGTGGPTNEQLSRKKVMDHVLERYKYMRARVGADDKQRLQQHIQGVEELVRGLESAGSDPMIGGGGSCTIPSNYKNGRSTLSGGDTSGETSTRQLGDKYDHLLKAYIDMTTHSFACGVSNIAVMKMYGMHAHGSVSHVAQVNDRSAAPAEYDAIVRSGADTAKGIKYAVDQLSMMSEGGESIMDNTLILWMYSLSDGKSHKSSDSRQLLVGNAGGAFDTGRLLKFNAAQERPHNELLTSVVNAFGVNDSNFGLPEWHGAGRLPNLNVNA